MGIIGTIIDTSFKREFTWDVKYLWKQVDGFIRKEKDDFQTSCKHSRLIGAYDICWGTKSRHMCIIEEACCCYTSLRSSFVP